MRYDSVNSATPSKVVKGGWGEAFTPEKEAEQDAIDAAWTPPPPKPDPDLDIQSDIEAATNFAELKDALLGLGPGGAKVRGRK